MKLEEQKYVDLKILPETLTLFYLSKITKIDLVTLTLLFEKMGTSLYYLFYMLAKKKISFPSEANLLKAIKFSSICEFLDNDFNNQSKISDRDKILFEELTSSIIDNKYIRVKLDEVCDETSRKISRTKSPSNKCELNSSIKKYIRKERRRLDRMGSTESLYEANSPTRIGFIDKITKIVTERNPDKEPNKLKELIITLIDGYSKNE